MTQEQANELITKAGARENAYTTDDYTNYYITFAKEDLEPMLKLEADRFQNLQYSEEAFKTESRAVLGEYNKNSANPGNKLYEVMRDSAFTTHTYKHTTMGFIRDIENMPTQFEYSKTFFDRWYRPERTTIIVAGDVTPAEVMPLIEKYWGGWKRGTFSVDIPKEPPPTGPEVRTRRMVEPHPSLHLRRLPEPGLLGDEQRQRRNGHGGDALLRTDVGGLQEARAARAEG